MEDTITMLLTANKDLAARILQNGKAEVVTRLMDAKFDSFIKCPVSLYNPTKSESIENAVLSFQQACSAHTKGMSNLQNTIISAKHELQAAKKHLFSLSETSKSTLSNLNSITRQIGKLSSLSYLNSCIGILNLGVNLTGFAVIGSQINALSGRVEQIADELAKSRGIQRNEVIRKYKKLAYQFGTAIDKMRMKDSNCLEYCSELLNDLGSYISTMIVNLYEENLDIDILMEVVYTLLPAYTAVLKYYILQYHLKTQQYPSNLMGYLSLFDEFLNEGLIQRISDYLMLVKNLPVGEMYKTIQTQQLIVLNCRAQVEDQIDMTEVIENEKEYRDLCTAENKAIEKRIDNIISSMRDKTDNEQSYSEEVHAGYRRYAATAI